MKKYLYLVLLLFIVTRIYQIGSIPPSVYWDEASIGYNAYSVLKTGKDEWGDFFPIHFRAFGEFKLPVYVYSVIPFIYFLDLNEISVRLPAVFFSLMTILLVYFLAKDIFQNQLVGIISSFLFTISPWFFIFSRTGYEATAGLMFYLLGIYLVVLSNKNNSLLKEKYLLISVLSFILSFYSYNSFRIIIILTVPFLFWIKRHFLMSFPKNLPILIPAVIITIISLVPTYRLYMFDHGASRLNAIGGFADTKQFIGNYLSHFSPDFLIFRGDSNLRSQQNFGEMYQLELLFFSIGLVFIVKNRIPYRGLLIFLFLIAFIPAAITKEAPHALRSILAAPLISIFSSYGIILVFNRIKNKIFLVITLSFFLIMFGQYYYKFLNSYSILASEHWNFGYKEMVRLYSQDFDDYQKIYISEHYAQPYIFTLFYLKYDPARFQSEVKRNAPDKWGFSTVREFSKFSFIKIDKDLIVENDSALIFTSPKEENKFSSKPDGEIKFLDGSPAFYVYKVNQ